MPKTTCPHCRRKIDFEMHEMNSIFECARCGGRFTPLGEAVPTADETVLAAEGEASFPDLSSGSEPSQQLLPNETILRTFSYQDWFLREGTFIVTTHRVRKEETSIGKLKLQSIMLEQIASGMVGFISFPWLLLLAALSFLFGIVRAISAERFGEFASAVVVSLVLVIFFFLTRHRILVIKAPATSMEVEMRAMNAQDMKELLDEIEAAKNNRFLLLSK